MKQSASGSKTPIHFFRRGIDFEQQLINVSVKERPSVSYKVVNLWYMLFKNHQPALFQLTFQIIVFNSITPSAELHYT